MSMNVQIWTNDEYVCSCSLFDGCEVLCLPADWFHLNWKRETNRHYITFCNKWKIWLFCSETFKLKNYFMKSWFCTNSLIFGFNIYLNKILKMLKSDSFLCIVIKCTCLKDQNDLDNERSQVISYTYMYHYFNHMHVIYDVFSKTLNI